MMCSLEPCCWRQSLQLVPGKVPGDQVASPALSFNFPKNHDQTNDRKPEGMEPSLQQPAASEPAAEGSPLPMDGYVTPTLTSKAISSQQTEIFKNFVLGSFPCHFRCTVPRVSVNWVQYVDQRQGSMDSCFDWAVRACTIAYLGNRHNDPRYIIASHRLYQRGLRGLARLLSNETTAKSDEALASAITLAVFETHNSSSSDAWRRHAAGIQTLMKLRGPKAHLEGFGRTMYLFYRSFFITAALVEGAACFLDEPEWQALNGQIAADIAKSPTSSLYTETVERGFLEVSKTPGFAKRTRELQAQSPRRRAAAQSALRNDVQASRAALQGICTEFGVCVSILVSGQSNQATFVGPIPRFFFEGYSSLFTRGLQLALEILEYLIGIMEPDQRPKINNSDKSAPLGETARNTGILTPNFIVQSLIPAESNPPATTDWMDHIISTMGLAAVSLIRH